jgi:hypothetical protein
VKAGFMSLLLGAFLACSALAGVKAQPSDSEALAPGEKHQEEPDPTRLDVARLPPEALPISRELYAHGWFLEAQLGALAFAGDANRVSSAGPRIAAAAGYEFWPWLSALLQVEASMHATDNRPPPSATTYELLGAALGVRFTAPLGAQAALWCGGLVGVNWASADVLRALGFRDAFKLGTNYGGELGFDWHVRARHHSLGLLGGARALPSLTRDGFTLAGYGTVYVRYVF